jgi:hypothetical protein
LTHGFFAWRKSNDPIPNLTEDFDFKKVIGSKVNMKSSIVHTATTVPLRYTDRTE